MRPIKVSCFLLLFFALISSDLAGQSVHTMNWPIPEFPRSAVAYSLEEALNRPLTIKCLYVWDYNEELTKRIPELENLEVLTFGYYDMDYFCQAYEFPVEFCRLKHLRSIDIIQAIDPLPDSLFKMRSLRKLWAGTEVPAIISLMDSLESFVGTFPPLPWPGSFKGLKYTREFYRYPIEVIENLPSIEEATLVIEVDSLGKIMNEKTLAVFAQKKHLKKLSIWCAKPMNTNQIPLLFSYLDQLSSLDELALESRTFTIKNAEAVTGKPSILLKNIKRLSITSGIDITTVLPDKFDSLRSFSVYVYSGMGMRTADQKKTETLISPEPIASRISNLELLSFSLSDESNADSISKKWLSTFTINAIQVDSLFILNSRGWGYHRRYGGYQDYYSTIYLPKCEKQILELIGNQKSLLHLTLDGFKFKSLNALTEKISPIPTLHSTYIEVLALDGKPFDVGRLNNFQRKNWILLYDELSTLSSSTFSKEPINYKFWKLCSSDAPYYNLRGIALRFDKPDIYGESAIPIIPYSTDSLPVSFHIHHPQSEFLHPEIRISYYSNGEKSYGCPFCDFHLSYYEDERNALFWNCDVRKDSRWMISPKEFKKGKKITRHGKTELQEQSISWYESGALKSMKQYDGEDVKEMKWTESGQPLYLLWHYNYTNFQDYTEAAWDTTGNMLWCRIYTQSGIAELRFYTNGHIQSKGWVTEGTPIGNWYFFDVAGKMIMGKAPAPLKVE